MIYYSSTTNPDIPATGLNITSSQLKTGLEKEKFKSFFIQHNNHLVEVFSGHVQSVKDKEAKPKGYLLLGRVVDSVYMSGIRSLSQEIDFKLAEAKTDSKEQIDPLAGSLQFPFAAYRY